jgi:hypothetical protein
LFIFENIVLNFIRSIPVLRPSLQEIRRDLRLSERPKFLPTKGLGFAFSFVFTFLVFRCTLDAFFNLTDA